MSSMLKKPGAGAFKPKAPIARRRPAPNLSGQSTPAQELTPGPSQDAATPSSTAAESTSRLDQPSSLPGTSTEATPTTAAAPSTSQITSGSSQGTPAAHPPPVESQESPAQPASRPQDSMTILAEAPSHDVGSVDTPSSTIATTDKTASSDQIESGHATEIYTGTGAARPEATVLETPSTSWATPPLPTPDATLIPSVETNDDPSASEPAGPAAAAQPKQQAPSKPRKRKEAPTAGEDEAGAGADTTAPPKKKRAAPRKKKATVTDGTENGGQEDPTEADAGTGADERPKAKPRAKTTKPRAPRQRKTATLATSENGVDRGSASDATEGAAASRRKRGGGRKRAATPEDAENLRIDPTTVTIGDLTRDIKTGKRWKDGQKILDADMERKREAMRQRLIRQGLLQEGEPLPHEANVEAGGSGRGTPAPQSAAAAAPAPATSAPRPLSPPPFTDMMGGGGGGGISIRVVDGQIVTNEDSMQYDRHAEADRVRGELEVREENDFSKRVTQLTYMARKTTKASWPDEDTAKFYHGLRMFGTDFNTIAKMFGGARDRRQIKLKFNREERLNPEAVNRCLIGEKAIAMDLEAVGGSQGLEDSEVIQGELARLREEREAETKRLEDEASAEAKRKRDELLGKRKGDNVKDGKGRHHHDNDAADMTDIVNGAFAEAIRNKSGGGHEEANPGAKYGVGTDPDVIDETDLPATSARSGGSRAGALRGRGARGGRRGGGKAAVFASGFGV